VERHTLLPLPAQFNRHILNSGSASGIELQQLGNQHSELFAQLNRLWASVAKPGIVE
jgi:hypothetical protein